MKFQVEISESELKDRQILSEMCIAIDEKVAELSEVSRNSLVNQIAELKKTANWCKYALVVSQKDRIVNKLHKLWELEDLDAEHLKKGPSIF